MNTRVEKLREVDERLLSTPVRVVGVVDDSIVDGLGVRMAVFFAGCTPKYMLPTGEVVHCPGCQNPGTQAFTSGEETTVGELLQRFAANQLECGVTLSGGDPMDQPTAALALAKGVHALGGNVWAFTGYTLDHLLTDNLRRPVLDEVNVLVDGVFEVTKRTLALPFRGSTNQRVLDLPASLSAGEPVQLSIDY